MAIENESAAPAAVDIPAPTVTVKDAQPIPAHIQRMLEEKVELDERIAKLTAFIRKPTTPGAFGFANLPEFERVCMYTQLNHMQGYSATLGLRLTNAGF